MARYDRDFLVPYLRDVCTLELMKKKLEDTKEQLERSITAISYEQEPCYAEKEGLVYTGGCIGYAGCATTVLGVLIGLFGGSTATGSLGLTLLLIAGAVLLISVVRNMIGRHSFKRNEISSFRANQMQRTADMKSHIPGVERELARVNEVLKSVYAANVIPGNYRNLYAAVYLNDYFGTSRSEDLDMALNTFVLEQIKSRLDTIIAQQAQMIINQRIMMANQQKMMSDQEAYRTELRQKLDRLHLTMSEQNHYLDIIESHLAASNYFAADQYFRNHRI